MFILFFKERYNNDMEQVDIPVQFIHSIPSLLVNKDLEIFKLLLLKAVYFMRPLTSQKYVPKGNKYMYIYSITV